MKFHLPWPPHTLSPNSRPHWSVKARSVKKYRGDACLLVKSASMAFPARYVDITFHPPNKRKRDLDNCLASFKAGLDGIADALGVNDNRFKLSIEMGDPIKGGDVEIYLS